MPLDKILARSIPRIPKPDHPWSLYRNPNIKFQPDALKPIYTGTQSWLLTFHGWRKECLCSLTSYKVIRVEVVGTHSAQRIPVTSFLYECCLYPTAIIVPPQLGDDTRNKISPRRLLSTFLSLVQPIKITRVYKVYKAIKWCNLFNYAASCIVVARD